jgi:hypothetical protein
MSQPVIDINKRYTEEELASINSQFYEIMANEITARIDELEKKSIQESEYKEHKKNCGETFEKFGTQLSDLNRAIFGDEKLMQEGIQKMVFETHKILKTQQSEKKVKKNIFPSIVSWSGGASTLIIALYLLIEFFKKLSKLG